MRFTKAMEYGIYALIYIGLESRKERKDTTRYVTIAEISTVYGFSRNHLMKVVHTIGRSDLIDTYRGKNGGIKLAKAMEDITLGDIVALFSITPSIQYKNESYLSLVHHLLQEPFYLAEKQYLLSLNQITLESLVIQFETKLAMIPALTPLLIEKNSVMFGK